ncbi:glycoside hydrolase family 20 zincin-like fold domain-containing protein [Streptomyces sp. NPDC056237]|uniref:glycoside hydrolase family 20 zincin-like fold domain-containing protein n=1 Tax=Streptomyces sp. NPDC056237 TaxID=3345758 RepID=UPI0035D75C56
MNLWPAPRVVIPGPGTVSVPRHVSLHAPDAGTDSLLVRLDWLPPRTSPAAGGLAIHVTCDPDLAPEAYRLEIDADHGVRITAGSADGAGHATVTLRQLLPVDAYRSAPLDRDAWVLP